jgi:hypothetical protein
MKRSIVLALALIACNDAQQRGEEDWVTEPIYVPHFDTPAMCPAPNTPQAESYVDHGSASAALEWLLLLNAMPLTPTYHVIHHYDEPSRPRYWGQTKPAPPRQATATTKSPSLVTRTFSAPKAAGSPLPARPMPSTIRIKTTSPAMAAPRPASYGFRTTSSPRPTTVRASPPRSR